MENECKCRSVGRRGNMKLTNKFILCNCFNPCNVCPSNARFVIFFTFTVADAARRHGLRIACGCVPRRERSLRRSSSPKKVTPRLCCSLVNALATRRLATNFFRYQAVKLISFLQTVVATNFLPYQAVKFCAFTFPLVGTHTGRSAEKTRANAVRSVDGET